MWLKELCKASSQELNISSPAEQPPAAGDRPGNFWESLDKVQTPKVLRELQTK